LQRKLEIQQAVDAERARLKQSEIYEWVQNIASNRFSFDEINTVVDILVTECGLFTLAEVAENSAEFTKDFFKEHKTRVCICNC
jgi:hypothetical protein